MNNTEKVEYFGGHFMTDRKNIKLSDFALEELLQLIA